MFNPFKMPSSHGSGNGASNPAGTGNSIFSSIGLGVPSMTSSSSASASASSAASTSASDRDLPAGWRVMASRETGKEYYLHLATGATQWDRPTDSEPPKRSGDATTPQQKQNVGNVFSSGVSRMGFGLSSMLTQANSRIQTTLQQKVGIASNAATTGHGKPHAARGHGADVDREGQLLVEVYENERLDGKLLPSDPKRYSDRHALPSAGFDELPEGDLPEGHEWATDWEIDRNYTPVDRDGWTYATDFPEIVRLLEEELSHASRHPADAVRRRRWIRYSHDQSSERPLPSPTASVESSSHAPSGSWGSDSVLDKVGSAPESNGALYDDFDDDPFHRTAQKEKKTFSVNMKFPHRGGKDNTKDYQSVNLSEVNWLLKDSDATSAPTDEMMREKTANLEERIKEATSKSVKVEKELRAEHEAKAKDIAAQQKKLDALIAEYRKVQRENATLQISVSAHRTTVEALRKEATEKDMLLNEEQRALNAEMLAANQTLEEKAKALATARMRYKRDNKALAASVEETKKRLEQQKSKAESDSQDPLAKELKTEMDKVRQLHAKLEAVREHRIVLEEERKTLYNLVVAKKADLKFKSKHKLETALKEVDEKLQKLKEEQIALTKQPDSDELRKRRNTIRSELGALRERRAVLLAEKRKQEESD